MLKYPSAVIQTRAKAALQLLFVADALSMPVHWYYNTQDILNAFPQGIRKFEAAPRVHPHDFLALPDSTEPNIVGELILKDKAKFWGIPNQHVHQGMMAGENTLNAHCARLVMRVLAKSNGHYSEHVFLSDYIAFMTAEVHQHPDTYAESYHRGFFSNLKKGLPATQCGLAADSAASVGGLVTIAPIAIAELISDRNLERVQQICRVHLFLTHPSENLAKICDAYIALIDALLFRVERESAKNIIAQVAMESVGADLAAISAQYSDDNGVIGQLFTKACSIENSWPGLLYLAYKYCDNPKAGLLANTNVGGENCHRGSVLGVILGLASANGLDDLFVQLVCADAINNEINSL